jgi:hypothetical protein
MMQQNLPHLLLLLGVVQQMTALLLVLVWGSSLLQLQLPLVATLLLAFFPMHWPLSLRQAPQSLL